MWCHDGVICEASVVKGLPGLPCCVCCAVVFPVRGLKLRVPCERLVEANSRVASPLVLSDIELEELDSELVLWPWPAFTMLCFFLAKCCCLCLLLSLLSCSLPMFPLISSDVCIIWWFDMFAESSNASLYFLARLTVNTRRPVGP